MFSLPLNIDCLSLIVDHLDVPDVVNACIAIAEKETVSKLCRDRLSPTNLFSELVNNSHELISLMSTCDCILMGSRALDYFYRGSCSQTSNWDFCVEVDPLNVANSPFGRMKTGLESLGVQWGTHSTDLSTLYGHTGMGSISGVMTKGRGKGHSIQLLGSQSCKPIDRLIQSHSTPVQCMITHYGAIHLYGKLTRDKKQIVWNETILLLNSFLSEMNKIHCRLHSTLTDTMISTMERLKSEYIAKFGGSSTLDSQGVQSLKEAVIQAIQQNNMPPSAESTLVDNLDSLIVIVNEGCKCIQDTSGQAIKKYESRGYEIMEFLDYVAETRGWKTTINDPDWGDYKDHWRTRCMKDSGTLIVPFNNMELAVAHSQTTQDIVDSMKFYWIEETGQTRVDGMRHEISGIVMRAMSQIAINHPEFNED